jgi:DNA-binding CsgD family transcriptional regulator
MWTFEEFVERSQQASTLSELKSVFGQVLADEGYENYIMTTLAESSLGNVVWSEFPRGFIDTYFAEGWDAIDPLIPYTLRTRRPFLWDDVVSRARLSPTQMNFMEDYTRMGLRSGIVFPMQFRGRYCDVIGISRRHSSPRDPIRLGFLHGTCCQTWCRYTDIAGKAFEDDPDTLGLTERELEILDWIKLGKSNADIGEILNISSKTVEYHVAKILSKLGASNRIAAVVIALRHGLISL